MRPILIFDYDGTIHDTLRIYESAFRESFAELVDQGLVKDEVISSNQIARWLGWNAREMWKTFQPELADTYREQASFQIGRRMVEQIESKKACWYLHAESVLDELKKRGYRMMILSNCKIAYREANWQAFHMERWFEKFYDCESFDFAPKTEIIKHIMQEYPGEYVVIGDRKNDMECARAVGCPFIGCLYGFGEQGELEGSDWLINDIQELLALLKV